MKTKLGEKMPKGFIALWTVITAVYAIWMTFFMKDITLGSYLKYRQIGLGEQAYTYPTDITGMAGREWLYPVWVVASVIFLALFGVYIKKMLFDKESGKGMKIFCLVSLILGCAFITWYGIFDVNKNVDGEFIPATFMDKVKYITASMIGLQYPWHFKMWGIFASESVFVNTLYVFRKNNYYSPLCIVLGSLGSAAIFMTINLPSMGEGLYLNSARCLGHWGGALLFAVLCAAPLVLFLFKKTREKNKKYAIAFFVFAAILATMLVLLVTVGKSAMIENLPMWAAYAVLFLINFTNVFEEKKATEKETVKA